MIVALELGVHLIFLKLQFLLESKDDVVDLFLDLKFDGVHVVLY